MRRPAKGYACEFLLRSRVSRHRLMRMESNRGGAERSGVAEFPSVYSRKPRTGARTGHGARLLALHPPDRAVTITMQVKIVAARAAMLVCESAQHRRARGEGGGACNEPREVGGGEKRAGEPRWRLTRGARGGPATLASTHNNQSQRRLGPSDVAHFVCHPHALSNGLPQYPWVQKARD